MGNYNGEEKGLVNPHSLHIYIYVYIYFDIYEMNRRLLLSMIKGFLIVIFINQIHIYSILLINKKNCNGNCNITVSRYTMLRFLCSAANI